MKSPVWLRARAKTIASTSVVTTAVLVVATLAMVYEGKPTTEVDLHDGGVWVTKQSSLLVGHFNNESTILDAGLRTTTDDYDILQSGDNVFVVDAASSAVSTLDPAGVVLSGATQLPPGSAVALGGSSMAVLEPEKGLLWVAPAASFGSFIPGETEPVAELGAGAAVAVGTDGTVHAVSAESAEIVTVPVTAQGEPGDPRRSSLGEVADDAALEVTAVGETAVVLDTNHGTVYGSNGLRAEVAGAVRLQQPSAASESVVLSTRDSLEQLPLRGGDPASIVASGEGVPAQPVFLEGCAYGVWSGSASFVRDCVGDADDLVREVPGASTDAELRFRVNRDVIVLNDVVDGAAWTAADDLVQVDNWNDITPPDGEEDENDEENTEETVETTLPERSEINTPPIAVDDDFGVRPGRTTVLPVLDNDSDLDGDILTVTLPDGEPSFGEIQSINRGSGLQIAVPDDASGSTSFTYRADDGRGGVADAKVSLSVRDWSTNVAPEQKRNTNLTIESGGVLSYNVLPDWIDPDGDDIFLNTVVPAPGDEVDFTADGRITYRSINGQQGRKDVEVTVSDGEKVGIGVLRLDVRSPGTTEPIANADHAVTQVGVSVTVSPLVNDVSTGTDPLRLGRVDPVDGARISTDFGNDAFTFVADAVATYYVQYLASAGSRNATGIVRIDVQEAPDADAPPIAVRDVALLPSAGEVLVDPLANDVDPAGGILVVQSVSLEPGTGISVSVIGHKTLRIADQGSLGEQVTVKYTVSNGLHSAEGEVIVIPVPGPEKRRPPVANDDTAVVRAGDVVTIPVLDNDYHPNGDTLSVDPELIEPLPAADAGEIFVAEDTVRFRASDQTGTVYATYNVRDSSGQFDAGYITIQVLAVDAETNQAPRPKDLVSRVLSGSRTTIVVPLNGIDPDGDSVELIGLASAPKKGSIVETAAASFVYEASPDASGTDTFSYKVRDNLGREATATIRVGVAPAEARNQSPYAVKDSVVMRPGREVAVPVLDNDTDPDGDQLALVKNGLILPDVDGLEASVLGNRVLITAPSTEMETAIQYTVRDERGAQSIAVVQITVDEDVPLSSPIARDDAVDVSLIEDDIVDVEVLANDEDPDGTTAALKVEIDDPAAQVRGDGIVRITLDDTSKLLTYSITDEDGLSSTAFIRVPSLSSLPPSLKSTGAIEVKSGETIEIKLEDHVRAAGKRSVVITEAAKVSALHSNGSGLVKDQTTLVYTSVAEYYGPDAITFEVTDGTGPDDPEGRKATLTIPITVFPPDNRPPTFVTGEMTVAPGEEPTSIDLLALTDDPDDGDLEGMTYSLAGSTPDGLTAVVEGDTLKVGAASDTPKGTQATLTVLVDDGEADPVEGTVNVTVSASTRPLATANDDTVEDVHQGATESVDVLANDFNPFPETPLKIVSAVTVTGDGLAEVVGDRVEVTPADNYVGTMTVRYRIQDVTKDADREVQGMITITVLGVPEAPGIPTVTSVQDRTVVLSWSPPIDNGARIENYIVSSVNGDYEKECTSTLCTLDGLTNNVKYNFTVVAVNAVGPSEPSLPSAEARPDARPDTPQPPTLVYGDRSLQIAWVTPTTPGSPVENFSLEISPAPPSGVSMKTEVVGNTMVWDGLENGTAYKVRVRAHNLAPDPSSWSVWSATEIPARAPEPVPAPSTTRLEPVGAQAQMQVSWAEPVTNGDAIASYQLQVLRGGSVVQTITGIAGTVRSQAVVIATSTTDYTFQVRASNKAGWGAWGPASAPRRAFVAPAAPTGVSAVPGDRRLTVSFTAGAGNGANASEIGYEYSLNGGNWAAMPGNRVITGLSNGTTYTVRVRAYTALDGVRYTGDPSAASAGQIPYGPVGTPGASASASGRSITYSWSAPADNGRGIQVMQISINGEAWKNVGRTGSETRNNLPYSYLGSIRVRAYDTEGQVSAVREANARTVAEPQPRAWTTKGSRTNSATCTSSYCAKLVLNWSNYPSGSYTVTCNHSNGGNDFSVYNNVQLGGNGSREFGCHFGGAPGTQAWLEINGNETERATW